MGFIQEILDIIHIKSYGFNLMTNIAEHRCIEIQLPIVYVISLSIPIEDFHMGNS